MKNEFLQNVNSLLTIVLAAEKKEQEKYYNAVSSNASDSTKLMAEANARIKKLREVIIRLKDFHFEVMKILECGDILLSENAEAMPAAADIAKPADCDEVLPAFEVLPVAGGNGALIEKVCEALIVAKPFKFLSMKSKYVGIDPASLDEPHVKLSNSMYVSTAGPADVVCREILLSCGIEEHEFRLYFEGA